MPGLELVIRDVRGAEPVEESFKHEGGITEYCDFLAQDEPVTGVLRLQGQETFTETVPLLDDLGLRSYPKTTGNRGIHVYTRLEPRWTPIEVRRAAVAVARELARRRPDAITDAWWKEERGERIFVDFNQNAPHKTVFGAWCVRPRPGCSTAGSSCVTAR